MNKEQNLTDRIIMNTNYASQIIKNLENKGESKDFIIGYLSATLDGLRHLNSSEIVEYMKRAVQQSQK